MKNWIEAEVNRLRNTTNIGSIFWLITITTCFSYLFFSSWDKSRVSFLDLYYLFSNPTFLFIGGVFTLIFLFVFLIKTSLQLNKQDLRKKQSWVFYFYWGIINTFLLFSFYCFTLNTKHWWAFLLTSTIIILCKWTNEYIGEKIDLSFKDFASGAVGIDNDKLDFKNSAKNTAEGLIHLQNYVNVVGVYGGLGFGKSSYARMIIENLNKEEVLYTYISLTETNEAKDFSKLFAERWLETLSARYPKIDITSYLPFMDSILRESGSGVLSDLLKIVSAFNSGLIKTKSKFFDNFYAKERPFYVSNRVAKLFGNITEIDEDVWVIMVDEIERAQFDEIYRLVEIIERFKNEGRSGLPTKLLFLFCISEPELSDYLDMYKPNDPRAHLLRTFFYEDPKSITHKIFLPPTETSIKQRFVLDLLNKVIDRENLDVPKEVSPHAIGDPSRSFMNHKDAAEYTIALLREESPRVVSRITNALDFFYGAFKSRAGEIQKNAIRFNDIVTLEYIKIKYPYLVDFFVKTINILVNQDEMNNVDAYFLKKELEEKKLDLIGWIELVTNKKIPTLEKDAVLKMVGLVMYYYFDFLNKDYDTKTKDKYFGTTSYPEVMNDYLSMMAEGIETNYRTNNRIYNKHKSNPSGVVTSLSNEDLISYTRFVFDVPSSPANILMDLIKELADRITNGKIKSEPSNVGDTSLDEAIYQLTFQIVALVEKEKDSDLPSKNIEVVFSVIKSVLSAPKLNTGVKFIMLSSFINNERGGGSSIHFRLENAFKRIMKYYESDIKILIKSVFKEAEDRYLNGSKILYEHEENFFYTLYQGWSGSKDSQNEIAKIRAAAQRGLVKHHEAIKLYWNKYPAKEEWSTLQDVFDNDRFFSMNDTNNPLYMPLETLINITKKANVKDPEIQVKLKLWDTIKDDPRVKDISIIKDDTSTLKSFLIRNGFL